MICIDLSQAYRAMSRRWFPNAVIVVDRFHAVRLAGLHLIQLARQLSHELAWNRSWLGVLRRAHDRLGAEESQRLAHLLCRNPQLRSGYEMKEDLRRLLCLKNLSKQECRRRIPELLRIIGILGENGLEAALTLAKSLSEWREEIVRMGPFSRDNGITQAFHRKMKLIQCRPYGFRSLNNYHLRVLAQCG